MSRPAALLIAVLELCLLVAPSASWALPRYSARYEQNCGLCHVNPTGGGQRTLYAAQFIVPAEMAMRTSTPEQLAQIDPQLSKNVSVGVDLRTMHHHADRHDIPYENFLQMQGAIDLTFQPDPRFLAYVSKGLSLTSEAYGLLYILPYHGYVKTGWFVPAFGWRFDDHTMFVRQKAMSSSNSAADLDGPPAPSNDVGIEVGTFPGRASLSVSLVNGNPGSNLDNNNAPAFAAQGIYRLQAAGLGAGLGGSFRRNTESQGRRTAAGPYGYLKLGRLLWLAESDWSKLESPGTGGSAASSQTMLTVSQEVSCLLRRGVELRGTYDFFDPDTHVRNGARYRYGAGFDLIPYPFLDFQAMVNVHHFEQGTGVTGRDYTQSEIQVHFFY